MALQRRLSGKGLAANRAFEVFIYRTLVHVHSGVGRRTIAVREKMPLKFRFLRKRLILPVAPAPAAIIPISFGSIHSDQVIGNEMLLQGTRVWKRRSACTLESAMAGGPFTGMKFAIHRGKAPTSQHRRRPRIQRWRRLARAREQV